ncbi:MAG: ParB/RepB/Spo0J family partition protein [Myxococcaceae bacterium]|nr:ParB/RepB/Spo0J family partition protein [Myxococcaceae bacterium]
MADLSNPQSEGTEPPAPDAVTTEPSPAVPAPVPESPVAEAVEAGPPAEAIAEDDLSDADEGEDDGGGEEVDLTAVTPHDLPRHFSAPALLPLDRLDDDDTFRFRPLAELEDVAALATDIARLGQIFPIDVRLVPPDRLQVVTGFRRVAALKFLQREKVVARLHTELSDADALLMALASAIHSRAVDPETLAALKERLEARGSLTPAARDMLAKALATDDELAPENVEEEVDADELAADVTVRLAQCNQDLSLLADVFDQLDDEKRDALLTQLKYSIDLVAFLESKK